MMNCKIPTPLTNHLDFEEVYEPAEDSFLLLDALEMELENIEKQSLVAVEVGCGSGIISVGLASVLKKCHFIACDINPHACQASRKTAQVNQVSNVQVVQIDFMKYWPFRRQKVDLILCNPPYVATNEEELGCKNIQASWAGGSQGRNLTDYLISQLPEILSSNGVAFIVLEQCNQPQKVKDFAVKNVGLKAEFILSRRAGREFLSVLKLEINNMKH